VFNGPSALLGPTVLVSMRTNRRWNIRCREAYRQDLELPEVGCSLWWGIQPGQQALQLVDSWQRNRWSHQILGSTEQIQEFGHKPRLELAFALAEACLKLAGR